MSGYKMNRAMMFPAMLIAVMAFSLIPGMAFAQAAPPASMTPSGLYETFIEGNGDNFTMLLLQQIFGSTIFASAEGGATAPTLFGNIVGYFNAAVLVVGGLMFLNNLATGTLQSAHEGEVMGRNWSSLWAPLRSIMAIALLIPLPNFGGYNTAQVFTAFIVKNATTFASSVWSLSATNVVSGVIPVTAPVATLPKGVVSEMFLIELCSVILNDQFSMGGNASRPDRIVKNEVDPEWSTRPIGEVANPGALHQARFSYDRVNAEGDIEESQLCGYYQTPAIPDVINNRVSVDDDSFDLGTVLGQNGSDTIRQQFINLHTNVMDGISTRMNAAAQSVYAAYKSGQPVPDISLTLEQALTTSRDQLTTGYGQIMNTIGTGSNRNTEVRQMMVDRISTQCEDGEACSGEGWIGAGSWYMLMARLNNEISTLFTAESEVKSYRTAGGEANNESGWWNRGERNKENALRDEYEAAYDSGVSAFNIAANRMASQGWNIDFAAATNMADSLTGEEVNVDESRAMNQIRNIMMRSIQYFVTPNAPDPMIGIVNFGQSLVPIGVIAIAADIVAPGNVLSTIGGAIATAGATMAIVLPLMPFVFWVMAVTGYFLLVVEAFIAVNLWALGMLKMDGEGIFGPHSRDGWLMILALMFTPVLMVAGFFVGMIIFRITSMIISMGLTMSLAGLFANANILFVIASVFVISVFMTLIYFTVLERSFSLVAEFPSRVLRWMGARADLDTSGADRVRGAALGTIGTTAAAYGGMTRNINVGPAVGRKVVDVGRSMLGAPPRNSATKGSDNKPPATSAN